MKYRLKFGLFFMSSILCAMEKGQINSPFRDDSSTPPPPPFLEQSENKQHQVIPVNDLDNHFDIENLSNQKKNLLQAFDDTLGPIFKDGYQKERVKKLIDGMENDPEKAGTYQILLNKVQEKRRAINNTGPMGGLFIDNHNDASVKNLFLTLYAQQIQNELTIANEQSRLTAEANAEGARSNRANEEHGKITRRIAMASLGSSVVFGLVSSTVLALNAYIAYMTWKNAQENG